jgi:CRP-like cAMP-binding protein
MTSETVKTVFSGSLQYFSVGDLIQMIGANGSTGVLEIESPYSSHKGKLFFLNGNPIDAACGAKGGLDAVYALFGYTHGEFQFHLKNIEPNVKIHESRMQIMLNGFKLLDDGIIEKLGPITFEKKTDHDLGADISLPLIKGPKIDYAYVLDEELFEAGSEIVMQGKHGNWLWVILDGTVQIVKEAPHATVKVVKLGQGAYVGSIASFLLGDYVRSATAIAESNVLLGVLDSHRLVNEFNSLCPEFKNFFLSLDRRLKQVTDHAVEYHQGNDPLADISEKTPYSFEKKDSEKMALIKKGCAHVVRETPMGEVLLAILQPGDFIGSLPFIDLDHEFYSAMVYASHDLTVERIDKDVLILEFKRLSTTLKNIISTVASSISATSTMACEYKKRAAVKQL